MFTLVVHDERAVFTKCDIYVFMSSIMSLPDLTRATCYNGRTDEARLKVGTFTIDVGIEIYTLGLLSEVIYMYLTRSTTHVPYDQDTNVILSYQKNQVL